MENITRRNFAAGMGAMAAMGAAGTVLADFLGAQTAQSRSRETIMENITRRNFAAGMGAMAAMGAAGTVLADFLGAQTAQADEAATDDVTAGYRAAQQAADTANPVTGDGTTTPLRDGIPGVRGSAQADEAATDDVTAGYRAAQQAADTANPVTGDGTTTPLRDGIPGVRGSANPMFQGPADPICTREEAIEWIANQPMVIEDYTQPDGKVIPAAYINLRNRWNRQGLGLGSNVEEGNGYWDWLMYNFSEREAWWYCMMPFPGLFGAADFAGKTGLPEYECREMCDTLAMKGLLIRIEHGQVPY